MCVFNHNECTNLTLSHWVYLCQLRSEFLFVCHVFAVVFFLFSCCLIESNALCGSSNSKLRCAIAIYVMLISYTHYLSLLFSSFLRYAIFFRFFFSVYCRHWLFFFFSICVDGEHTYTQILHTLLLYIPHKKTIFSFSFFFILFFYI